MTDYNDGKWHRWAGDGIPPGVHEESLVETRELLETGSMKPNYTWRGLHTPWPNVCAFRVTKVHREPFKIWAAIRPNGRLCRTAYKRDDLLWDKPVGSRIVLLREVIE